MSTNVQTQIAANEANWTITQIYVIGSFTLLLSLSLLIVPIVNLAKEWSTQRRRQLLWIHGLVATVFVCRMLEVLLGFYGTKTFFATAFDLHVLTSEIMKSISCAALLLACSMELLVFIQIGWAATLRIEELSFAKRAKWITRFGAVLLVVIELLPHFLSSPYAQIATFSLEIIVAFGLIAVLCTALLNLAAFAAKRNSVQQQVASASWRMPSDDQTMAQHSDSQLSLPDPPPKSVTKTKFHFTARLLAGLRLLPRRAQHAYIAVVVGLLFIATQTTSELMYEVIELDESASIGRAVQTTETVMIVFQAASAFAISHSTRVMTSGSEKSINFLANSPSKK